MKENLFERKPVANDDQVLTPETRTERQEGILVPEQALKEEKDRLQKTLERFGGEKIKRVITSLILVSSLVFSAGTFEAHASGKKQDTTIEQIEHNRREQITINFLERLLTLPDTQQLTAAQRAQLHLTMLRRSQLLIKAYALNHKLGFPEGNISGNVSQQDIKKALEELNIALYLFADKNYGNNDGETNPQEFNEMSHTHRNNPGFQTLMHMMENLDVR